MDSKFRQILVLIGHSNISIHAAEEAALLASRFDSEVHLLHISSSVASKTGFLPNVENLEEVYYEKVLKLERIRRHLKKTYSIVARCHVTQGEFYTTLKKYIKELEIDLLVIGVKKPHWLRDFLIEGMTKRIMRSVQSEVLSVHGEGNPKRLKKIVLPVGKFIPEKGIKLAHQLARKFGANLHLISSSKSGDNLVNQEYRNLIASYQLLKEITNMPVECKTLSGDDLAQATMKYAECIDADMILMDGGSKNHITDNVLRKCRNILLRRSSIPVLNV
jgi:nucleotide-binding universal stress UspA family protein